MHVSEGVVNFIHLFYRTYDGSSIHLNYYIMFIECMFTTQNNAKHPTIANLIITELMSKVVKALSLEVGIIEWHSIKSALTDKFRNVVVNRSYYVD